MNTRLFHFSVGATCYKNFFLILLSHSTSSSRTTVASSTIAMALRVRSVQQDPPPKNKNILRITTILGIIIIIIGCLLAMQFRLLTTEGLNEVEIHPTTSTERNYNYTELFEEIHPKKTFSTYKPKLILHIGPMKTGTTSIQLNIFQGKHFKPMLDQDFQVVLITQTNFAMRDCLGDRQCEKKKSDVQKTFDDAYKKAMEHHHHKQEEEEELITLNTLENWSLIPLNESTFRILTEFFQIWDLHIVMFYRPYLDWVVSLAAHHSLLKFRYFSGYRNHENFHYIIADYFEKRNTLSNDGHFGPDALHDALHSYQLFDTAIQRLGLPKQSALGIDRIKVLDMHSPNGIEKEFISYLPQANRTKKKLSDLEKSGFQPRDFKLLNKSDKDHILGKRFMLEAWKQDMVSVDHSEKDFMVLKALFETANMTKADLPHICLTDEHEEMIWQRHLANHMMFAPMIEKNWDSSKHHDVELELRKQFDERKKSKLCNVDVMAALKLDTVKKIFDHCDYHSKHLINADLSSTERMDPKWVELGCEE